ncbi:ABC transporter ATP-binding protein [Clostridium sediminicola]|uniref:ABC transporter ATP-binding protein n=1 Tax=Clostridium sediminicola TaxID=3114879 RepID=UPI0031F27F67
MKKGISIKNMTKIFITNKNTQVIAVDNVNLEIEPGEFVTLLGPSGCGKTTILRMVAGFETLTMGKIFIGDENVADLTPDKRDTALVFQNYALFPHMNVYDNIAYGLKLQKLQKSEVDRRVQKILKLMKMEDFADRVPSQMSGGQQQRVSLARALVMEPGVLLFDEPLSNLDAKLRIHMRDEIRKIQQEVGITSLYVTHDQAEAMGLSDKVVIMKDGVIQQVGSPREIYQKPANEFVAGFIGKANIVKGIVKERNEKEYKIAIEDVIYSVNSDNDYTIGNEVAMVIRPESIIIGKEDFKTKVTKSRFMGENHEYEVEKNGQNIQINQTNPFGKRVYEVDELMWIGFDEKALHILK